MLTQNYPISKEHRINRGCPRAAPFEAVGVEPDADNLKAKSEVILTSSIIGRLEVAHIRVVRQVTVNPDGPATIDSGNSRFVVYCVPLATSNDPKSPPTPSEAPTVMNIRRRAEFTDGQNALFLSILLDGDGCFKQDRRTIIQGKHEIILCSTDTRFLYDFGPEAILIKIPRNLLVYRHAEIQDVPFPLRFSRDLSLNALMADLVMGAMTVELASESGPIVGERLASSIVHLVSAVIGSEVENGWAQRHRRRTKLERAQSYIAANLSDEKLSPEVIAKHAAVSLRTLNRLFAQVGTTPMRWVWQRRLEESHSALVGRPGTNIADVAFKFGFREVSHFSRSFKAVYGASPAQIAKSRGRI